MSKESQLPGEISLQAIAQKASKLVNLQVVLAPQTDTSFMLKAALIHPCQALENSYQRIIREAVRRELDTEKHRDLASAKLTEYFPLDAGEPQLINPPDDAPEMLEESFRTACENLSQIKHVAQSSKTEGAANPISASTLEEVKKQLRAVVSSCRSVIDEFENIRAEFDVSSTDIPILTQAGELVLKASQAVESAASWEELTGACAGDLRQAMLHIDRMLEGLACVQIFHVIDTFYLYRLLVRYRVEADKALDADDKMKTSSELTGILNNGKLDSNDREWLVNWLKQKMRDIDKDLKELGNVHFHLKGGRALEYVRRCPEKGRNDWDTSALIDPELSAEQWYAKFTELHNLLVLRLRRYKREFFVLVHKHSQALILSLEDPVENNEDKNPLDENGLDAATQSFESVASDRDNTNLVALSSDTDAPVRQQGQIFFPVDTAGCKAELIDIGIPRRDTVQAFAHWHHIGPGLIRKEWTSNIPVPDHRYYIDEYVTMIRDAFELPTKKMEKRISRIAAFLNLGSEDNDPDCTMDSAIQNTRKTVSDAGLGKSLQVIDAQGIPVKRLMTVMLEEFVTAYELDKRPGLKTAFDDYVSTEGADSERMAQCIGEYPDSIVKALPLLSDGEKLVLKWIAFSHGVSRYFEAHLREKARTFGFDLNLSNTGSRPKGVEQERRKAISHFIKWLYTESVFSPEEELEVQFAIAGSFAAHLHADYASTRIPPDLKKQLESELDPVDIVEIKMFCHPVRLKNAKPEIVWEALLDAPLKNYVEQYKPPFEIQRHDNDAYIIWRDELKMGEVSYKPLVARIRIVTEGWPQLSYVWGFPILSLPDLIREYFAKAGTETEEYMRVSHLTKTSALLKAILTYFEAGEMEDFSQDTDTDNAKDVESWCEKVRGTKNISSTKERSEALRKLSAEFIYHDKIVTAIIEACSSLKASDAIAGVLKALLVRKDLGNKAFIEIAQAIKLISSNKTRADVLTAMIKSCPLIDEVLLAFLDSTLAIESSDEKKDLILLLLSNKGVNGVVIAKATEVANSIKSAATRKVALDAVTNYKTTD